MSVFERFRDLFGSGAGDPHHDPDHDGHDHPGHGQEGGSPSGADGTAGATPGAESTEPRSFDDVRDEFVFTGFSESQQDTILGQLEEVWETESGRSMIEAGLDGPGLHYMNINEQSVISTVSPRIGMTPDQVPGIGNFALPTRGEIFLNAYPALEADGSVQVYSGLHPALDGQSADAKDPIRSLDTDGEVFTVPPLYTMIHETNHVARGEPDIPRNRAPGVEYDPSMVGTTSLEAAQAYAGLNEVSTREILTEMGLDQQRGAYNAAGGLDTSDPGTDYGLGRDHDVGVTSARATDMTGHAPVDAVVIDSLTQDALNRFGVPSRTDLLDHTFLMGSGDDTVHAFDGNDALVMGGGDDRGFAGPGDDVFVAGRGNDIYDGGAANLDPTSDHRSDAATDWGFDTVSYTEMPEMFAPPTVDGAQIGGVVLSVSSDAITVDKGQPFAPSLETDTDRLNNIDRVIGTDRDDVASVSGFADGTVLDGAGGADTLDLSRLPSTVTNVPGAGTFNGVPYDGYIDMSGARLYYNDYENFEMPPAPTLEALATEASMVAPDTTIPSVVPVSLQEAADVLRDAPTESLAPSAAGRMMESGGADAMLRTLEEAGETQIEVDREGLQGEGFEPAQAVLRGAAHRLQDRGLGERAAEMHAELQREATPEPAPEAERAEPEMEYSIV